MSRAIWVSLMAVLAVIASAAQLDRSARRDPALAPLVPVLFRNFAQERLTMATVRSAGPEQALADARRLVRRSPLPAEHVSLLAIAEERNGARDRSGVLVQRAAQRGWRDPIAQQAMFAIALAAGQHREAANRLAALYAVQEDQAPLSDLTAQLQATPQGRSALAEALVAGGHWTNGFLYAAATSKAPESRMTIALALERGANLDCGGLRLILGNAPRADDPMVAATREHCGS